MGSKRKPLVGIVHSASSKATSTGEDLAIYVGVCLQLGDCSSLQAVAQVVKYVVNSSMTGVLSAPSTTLTTAQHAHLALPEDDGKSSDHILQEKEGAHWSTFVEPGYSDVRIVGFGEASRATPKLGRAPRSGRFCVVPYRESQPTFPNHAECCRDDWRSLSACNMILLFVEPADTSACAEALAAAVGKGSDVAIVVFDLGVRNHAAAEDSLGGRGIILLAGAVGINVVRSPVDGHLSCLGSGSLVIERLSKTHSKQGVKFVNLLRSSGIPTIHCKNVSSYAHGALVFNTVHAAVALAGISLDEFVRNRGGRLLWAQLIREGLQVLKLAAKGGDWRPANPCASVTLPQLELLLCLPIALFGIVSRILLRFRPTLAPSMQKDLALGRDTAVAWTLGELVRLADVHKAPAPACRGVLVAVKRCVSRGDGVPSIPPAALPFAAELRSHGSASTQALEKKCALWFFLMVMVGAALYSFGGVTAASSGILAMLLTTFVKFALMGDVVP